MRILSRLSLLCTAALVLLSLVGVSAASAAGTPPTCYDFEQSFHAGEGRTVYLDCFPDGDFSSVPGTVVSGPTHGTFVPSSDPNDGPDAFVYTPTSGYSGDDTVTFKATNDAGDSNVATATFHVSASDQAPDCFGDGTTDVYEGHTNTIYLDCSDPEDDTISYSLVPGHGPSHGTVSGPDAENELSYTPNSGYTGSDSFEYQADDGHGGTTVGAVELDVTTPPAPQCEDPGDTPRDVRTAHATDVYEGCYDAAGDNITVEVVAEPSHGTLDSSGDVDFTYTSDAGFEGSDSFQFRVTSDNGTSQAYTQHLNVAPDVNSAPECFEDTLTAPQGRTTQGNVDCYDNDGDPMTFDVTQQPAHGSLSGPEDSGDYTYTPDPSYQGDDSFTFTATDSMGASSGSITVPITVAPPQPPQCATPDPLTIRSGQSRDIYTDCSDPQGDPFSLVLDTGPQHGSLVVGDDGDYFTYTANAGASGSDSFSYHVENANGRSASVTQQITESPSANNAPNCDVSDNVEVRAGGTFKGYVGCYDPDGDASALSISTPPAHGSVDGPLVDDEDSGGGETDATITYDAPSDYTGDDSFVVHADDGHGGVVDVPVSVTVESSDFNRPPSCYDDFLQAETGQAATYDPGQTCYDADGDSLTPEVVTDAQHGHVTVDGSTGHLVYTSQAGYEGDDSFTYRVSDAHGGQSTAVTVSVSVSAATNHAPECDDLGTVSVSHDTAKSISLDCFDQDDDNLTYSVVSGPSHGTVSNPDADGNVTYTPTSGYAGPDSFTYRANDGTTNSALATVSLNVATDHAPTCSDESVSTPAGTAKSISFGCSDADGDALTYVVDENPSHGFLTGIGVSRTYTPNGGFNGTDSITFHATDGKLSSDQHTVTIDVGTPAPPVNHAPTCANASVPVRHATPTPVSLHCTDADGDALTYSVVSGPGHGSLSGSGASRTYTPASTYAGADSIAFRASDGTSTSNTATIELVVAAASGGGTPPPSGTHPGGGTHPGPTRKQLKQRLTTDLKGLVKALGKLSAKTFGKRGASARFHWLEAGRYSVAVKATVVSSASAADVTSAAKKKRHVTVVVASGSASRGGAGSKTVKVKLTSKGRKLLAHSHKLRTSVTATFAPKKGAKSTTTAHLTLKGLKKH